MMVVCLRISTPLYVNGHMPEEMKKMADLFRAFSGKENRRIHDTIISRIHYPVLFPGSVVRLPAFAMMLGVNISFAAF